MSDLEKKLRSSTVQTTGYAVQPGKVVTGISAYGNRFISHVTPIPGVTDVVMSSGATLKRPRDTLHYVTNNPRVRVVSNGVPTVAQAITPVRGR